jgi:catechol 2,3-dioxygenase-like lactoylglutathione lyase family enzyme
VIAGTRRRAIAWYQDVLELRRVHQQSRGDFPPFSRRRAAALSRPSRAVRSTCFRANGRIRRTCATPHSVSTPVNSSARAELRHRGMLAKRWDFEIARSLELPDPNGSVVEIADKDPR